MVDTILKEGTIIKVKGGGICMASSQLVRTQLQLVFQVGVDQNGKGIYKNKNFNNIKTSATPEQLYTIAKSLEPLQQWTLHEIERNDTSIVFGY